MSPFLIIREPIFIFIFEGSSLFFEASESSTNWKLNGALALSLLRYARNPKSCADEMDTFPLIASNISSFAESRVEASMRLSL